MPDPGGRPAPADEFVFLPLGGSSEIGMNLTLYGYGPPGERRWLMIDLGITFNAGIPGVDVILPDPAYIAERRDRLEALVLTHAHEDHLGAVPYLWPRLRCPVYGSPFTLAVLGRKLDAVPWGASVPLRPLPPDGRLSLGPFGLQTIAVTHSIPEASAVAVTSPLGTVVHTGDWKFDPDPVIGPRSDEATLRRLGDDGVLALICDSTNVFERGRSGSEGELKAALTRLIAGCRQRVVVTCFASNVARLQTIALAAAENGRDVVMTGHSLKRNYAAALACGYLTGLPPFIDDRYAVGVPRDRVLIVCTGGQGEPRAALSRLAEDEHPTLRLEADDAVIFSSRVIPGNELPVGRLVNQLIRKGVRTLTQRDGLIHASGHPAEDELAHMYRLVRPRVAVPVHGELRHLLAHARLARREGAETAIIAENGAVVRLAPGPAGMNGRVAAGRLVLEGNRVVPIDGALVKERSKALYNGVALVTLALGGSAPTPGDVQITTIGLLSPDEEEVLFDIRTAVATAVADLPAAAAGDDAVVRETVRLAVRRNFRQLFEKKPVTHVHLVHRR